MNSRVRVNRNGYKYDGRLVGHETDPVTGYEEVTVEKDDGTLETELPEHVTRIEE